MIIYYWKENWRYSILSLKCRLSCFKLEFGAFKLWYNILKTHNYNICQSSKVSTHNSQNVKWFMGSSNLAVNLMTCIQVRPNSFFLPMPYINTNRSSLWRQFQDMVVLTHLPTNKQVTLCLVNEKLLLCIPLLPNLIKTIQPLTSNSFKKSNIATILHEHITS